MEDEKISSGSEVIDELLESGYDKGCISTIYGPGGSGKTNLCILFGIEVARKGKKVIYVDTDGSFSFSRFSQLSSDKGLLDNFVFFRPTSFAEQKKTFSDIREIVNHLKDKVGTIIVDSIAMLYRLEIGKTNDVYEVNRELGVQVAYLVEIARKQNIPVILTNQVYSVPSQENKISMVGGDLLKYASKCLIELKKYQSNVRVALLRKHRSLPEKKQIKFKITQTGIKRIPPL